VFLKIKRIRRLRSLQEQLKIRNISTRTVKLLYQVMRHKGGRIEFWASIVTLTCGTNRTADVSCTRRPPFTSREIPWCSCLLTVEWTPGVLNTNRRNRSLENFQGPYRESHPKPPVLWRIASTNWDIDRPRKLID